DAQTMRYYVNTTITSPKLKEALRRAIELHDRWAATQRELAERQSQLRAIAEDQTRLRANLREMPQTAAASKRYLEKFDKPETEIEKMQADNKKLQEREGRQRKEYEGFLSGLEAE